MGFASSDNVFSRCFVKTGTESFGSFSRKGVSILVKTGWERYITQEKCHYLTLQLVAHR